MGFFKVLGGVALGVGAIAAAPFTGGGSLVGAATLAGSLAGAGTVAAAVGAGAAGAAAGYALSEKEEEERRREREQDIKAGEAIATQTYEPRIQESEKNLAETTKRAEKLEAETQDYLEFHKKQVGKFAVGMAMVNADGKISPEERKDIITFLEKASANDYPPTIIDDLRALVQAPPSFEQAVAKAKEYGVQKEDIGYIIERMALIDGVITNDEQQLIDMWNSQSVAWDN